MAWPRFSSAPLKRFQIDVCVKMAEIEYRHLIDATLAFALSKFFGWGSGAVQPKTSVGKRCIICARFLTDSAAHYIPARCPKITLGVSDRCQSHNIMSNLAHIGDR